MRFNKHLKLQGEHAFLSPSNYHWINYTPNRLSERWTAAQASAWGVAQHEYAMNEIRKGRLSDHEGMLGTYINDCIKFRMEVEQVLFYSEHCFGTADAISFRYKKLRISDLKTGLTKASVHQLEVYAALFCLEYDMDPFKMDFELRIYQGDEVSVYDADPEDIMHIMEKIVEFDRQIEQHIREEAS
jgi:hypothetical protein